MSILLSGIFNFPSGSINPPTYMTRQG